MNTITGLNRDLNAIADGSAQKDKALAYKQLLLTQVLPPSASPSPSLLQSVKDFVSHAIQESVGLVTSRQLLQDFVEAWDAWVVECGQKWLGIDNAACHVERKEFDDFQKTVLNYVIEATQNRQVAFEEQVSKCLQL